jgi:hypothetical protein
MKKLLKSIYGRRKEVKENWRKLQNVEINKFYSSPNRVTVNFVTNLKIISTVS